MAESASRHGVLVVNLGTPDAPTPAAVRRYLGEFLSDDRVVEIPRAIWLPLLWLLILPLRARRVARAYAEIWTERGSPLRFHTGDLAAALGERIGAPVQAAFRYGKPGITQGIDALLAAGCDEVVVLPLYPQYSSTTSASVFDGVAADLRRRRVMPAIRQLGDYHAQPEYIAALAASVRRFWEDQGRGDKLLMSFHGLPARNIELGDPYRAQCEATAAALAVELDLSAEDWTLAFQSRFGRAEWLQPYADVVFGELGATGLERLDVICPGFAADCLETLEEIRLQGGETFTEAGGKELRYIPALNAHPDHADALAALLRRALAPSV